MNEKINEEIVRAQLEHVAEQARRSVAGKLAIVMVHKEMPHEDDMVEAVYMGVSTGKKQGPKEMVSVAVTLGKAADALVQKYSGGQYRLMLLTPSGITQITEKPIVELRG